MLSRLAGLDIDAMTEHRVTDSVGSEFVEVSPAGIELAEIEEMAKKFGGNILKTRLNELNASADKDEVIQNALNDKPDGVFYSEYDGPRIKVMYVECDGTGVPGIRKELEGAKGKQSDGSAKTFEAKIGAVFVVEYTADGKPLLTKSGEIYRDKKVDYMGTVRKIEDFGPMFYRFVVENRLEDMDAVVFLGDGANWVWNLHKKYFPYALAGLDLYHATERLNDLQSLLKFGAWGIISGKKQKFNDECHDLLKRGKVQDMLDLIDNSRFKPSNSEKFESAMDYFRSNIERMDYGAFSACGIYVGSGVIEAGCKVIVGNRMKNAGMHWSKDSAEKMINLRCAVRNGAFFDTYINKRTDSTKSVA